MTLRMTYIVSAIVAGTFAMSTRSVAQEHAAGAASRPANPLHEEMEGMGKAFKQIKAQAGDGAKNASTLELLQEMERHTLAAKGMTPRGAATRPAEEREKYLAEYRVDMANALRLELELEEIIADGQNAKAAEAVEAIGNAMGEGHKEFKPKKKRAGN
jgi:Cytochrome b562